MPQAGAEREIIPTFNDRLVGLCVARPGVGSEEILFCQHASQHGPSLRRPRLVALTDLGPSYVFVNLKN